MDERTRPIQKSPTQSKKETQTEIKGWKKDISYKWKGKQARRIAILILDRQILKQSL